LKRVAADSEFKQLGVKSDGDRLGDVPSLANPVDKLGPVALPCHRSPGGGRKDQPGGKDNHQTQVSN